MTDSFFSVAFSRWQLYHTLLPAIETTDVIRNTENKQVERNMGRYFQHNFMLFPLNFGSLFYDTCVVIIIRESCIKYGRHSSDTGISTIWWMLKFVFCWRILWFFSQSPDICCTFVGVYQIFSISMTRLQSVPFLFSVINVVLTICCVWWVCFSYREQQTIVIFAIIDDRIWRSGPKF